MTGTRLRNPMELFHTELRRSNLGLSPTRGAKIGLYNGSWLQSYLWKGYFLSLIPPDLPHRVQNPDLCCVELMEKWKKSLYILSQIWKWILIGLFSALPCLFSTNTQSLSLLACIPRKAYSELKYLPKANFKWPLSLTVKFASYAVLASYAVNWSRDRNDTE